MSLQPAANLSSGNVSVVISLVSSNLKIGLLRCDPIVASSGPSGGRTLDVLVVRPVARCSTRCGLARTNLSLDAVTQWQSTARTASHRPPPPRCPQRTFFVGLD
ncbi:hypothetical protein RRG08_000761 [Elysia crispata]|uniref:Uncharacterized protein n=1 Tax=Elysia crispata TaxID=231223 RepID=A0AAE0YKB8_9GAST|nr:hypothetical protein RRG08_000761 [Elysia crispata]